MGNTKHKNEHEWRRMQAEKEPEVPPEIVAEFRKRVRDYRKSLKYALLTSRFSDTSWEQNVKFRQNNKSVGCIYSSPTSVSRHIIEDSIMFIIEMNNTQNKIMGIGMVKNHPNINKYGIYEYSEFNRFMYAGKLRIDRSDMSGEEEKIMGVLDKLCFTGKKHLKRGTGITMFPAEMLYRMSSVMDLVEYVRNMFKRRMQSQEPTVPRQYLPFTSGM